jgi:hypothetical protein
VNQPLQNLPEKQDKESLTMKPSVKKVQSKALRYCFGKCRRQVLEQALAIRVFGMISGTAGFLPHYDGSVLVISPGFDYEGPGWQGAERLVGRPGPSPAQDYGVHVRYFAVGTIIDGTLELYSDQVFGFSLGLEHEAYVLGNIPAFGILVEAKVRRKKLAGWALGVEQGQETIDFKVKVRGDKNTYSAVEESGYRKQRKIEERHG